MARGCIIRAKLLNEIMKAFERDQSLPNLLIDREFQSEVNQAQDGLAICSQDRHRPRRSHAFDGRIMAYYDSYRSERLPANLIQAQRDFFGAHTFERIDKPGSFHENWVSK